MLVSDADLLRSLASTFPRDGSLAVAFAHAMDTYSARPCLGWRVRDEFVWCSYASFARSSRRVAAALALRVRPGARIGIMGTNCCSWYLADFGCLWAGVASVPLSKAWDQTVLEAMLAHTACELVFCSHEYLPRLRRAASSSTVSGRLRVLVHFATGIDGGEVPSHSGGIELGAASTDAPTPRSASGKGACDVLSLADFIATSAEGSVAPVARPPEAVHTILHTSGTTGLPKGVVYSDRLWLANMAEYDGLQVGFSYMPLAFITDRHTAYTTLWNGGRLGISTPAAPAGADAASAEAVERQLFGDLLVVKPTVLKGVPRFFEQVYDASKMVHDKSLKILGGKVRILCCGAGAISTACAAYFRERCTTAEGEPVAFLELYGATECGNLACNRRLQPHVEWKVLPVDGDHGGGTDDVLMGEFVVKTGAMMFSGYFGDEARTRSAFTDDGYYKTGDVVRLTLAKTPLTPPLVEVIGRAKSSIKLGNGKWVHPEELEDLYRGATGVNHVFLHGDSSHTHLVAVVDASDDGNADALVSAFAQLARAACKPSHEHVAAVVRAEAPFSTAAGTLNGTGKLVRPKLRALYGGQLSAALSECELNSSFSTLEHSASFSEQGGTSLQAARIAQLYVNLGVPLQHAIKVLLSSASVGAAKTELKQAASLEQHEPEADCRLRPLPPPVTRADDALPDATRVLLTGATGFVGSFVLAELLARGCRVACLVRANNDVEAMQRTHHALLSTRRWKSEWREQLSVHCGSLGADMLGLGSVERWCALADSVHTCIHCGAVVDLTRSYGHHFAANVQGTLEVIRLCEYAKARMLFVSTTDVLPESNHPEVPMRVADVRQAAERGGYAASKAVGEVLVAAAAQQGDLAGGCVIARLGMVAGCSETGTCAPTDFVSRLLVGIADTGCFPETDGEVHTMVHSLPVDVAARALVDLAEHCRHDGNDGPHAALVNIVSGAPPQSMAALRSSLVAFGPPFDPLPVVPYAEWMRRVRADAALSLWPAFSWAAKLEAFPRFNQRCPSVSALSTCVSESTAEAIRRGFDEPALHRMLANLLGEE